MRVGQATGLQVAFLMFAVMLLAVPVTRAAVKSGELTGTAAALAERCAHFALACLVILSFPHLRRFARQALSAKIAPQARPEVALVALATLSIAFASTGAMAAGLWWSDSPERAGRLMVNVDGEIAKAFSAPNLVRMGIAVLVAPIVEELVFRGFIYRAFERRWGWLAAMLATSILFGLYHPLPWSAFASSIVFVCVMRRTGSIRAPILAHMLFNLMLWWPLLGQHVFPHGPVPSDPAVWYFHSACLAFVIAALPIYARMSRDRDVVAPTVFLEPDAALPK